MKPTVAQRERRRQRKQQRRLTRAYRPGKGRWMVRVVDGKPRGKLRWIPSWKSLHRKSEDTARRMNERHAEEIAARRAGLPTMTREEWKNHCFMRLQSYRKIWNTRCGVSPPGTRRVPRRHGGMVLMATSIRSKPPKRVAA